MVRLNSFSNIDAASVALAADNFGTPVYVYDEHTILKRCRECLRMPNAFGLTVRYAMKANSNRSLLRLISDAGLNIDASSLNEAVRANLAGIPYGDIMLTTQEVYEGAAAEKLHEMLLSGLRYNACSIRQLRQIAGFAAENGIDPGIRVHPGTGSGESATRNTGDDYACFGVHIADIDEANNIAAEYGLKFRHIHEHIGSGADSQVWRQNIDHELGIVERFFPDAESISFGGGLKEARMPDEFAADIYELGAYAKERIEGFYGSTGRKLSVEIEPGTYIVANSGYTVARVVDKKRTSRSSFIIIDGGMEVNARPQLYGSRHPVYIVAGGGKTLKSSEFSAIEGGFEAIIAGVCCETGDCQTLSPDGQPVPRPMAEPETGDIAVIGGTGAYCSSMAPFNYNSHTQIPEVLLTESGELKMIRKRQTMEQMVENEV